MNPRALWALLFFTASVHAQTTVEVSDGNNPAAFDPGDGVALFYSTEEGTMDTSLVRIDTNPFGSVSITTTELNFTTINGEIYIELVFDFNESGGSSPSPIELDDFYLSSGGVAQWDLEADGFDNSVVFNGVADDPLTAQSGDPVVYTNGPDIDAAIYIPVGAFDIYDGATLEVHWDISVVGGSFTNGKDRFGLGAGDGTQFTFPPEPPPVPEPASWFALATGTLLLLRRRRRVS